MKLRRNAFYDFALLVFLTCLLYAMACVFQRLGQGQEYPYLPKGEFLICALVLIGGLALVFALSARLELRRRLGEKRRLCDIIEWLLVLLILAAGTVLRAWVIRNIPVVPSSDYETYFKMAELIHRGRLVEEGVGYCDYVAMFPHVFGYPAVLARVFDIFGASLRTALLFNLVLSMGGCLLIWRIGRLLGGRLCGLSAMAVAAFMPSTILYSNLAASEPLFTFLLLLAIWLFIVSMKDTPRKEKHPWLCAFEIVAMGLTLAIDAFVRPMAIILLIAMTICMLSGDKPLPAVPRNDIPLGHRFTARGWKRCLLLFAVYFGMSTVLTMGTGYAVDRKLAGSSASYGYNLLVGLNLESYGGWNQEDADYLYASFDDTGSAQEAHLACREMAIQRLKVDPRALLDLFVHKFEVLWGNDDYGASWNILFCDQQSLLTPEMSAFLYHMMDVSDMYYLFVLLGAFIAGILMIRHRPDGGYVCVLMFCGTVALHLLVENQNRYHYHGLLLLAILCGTAMHGSRDIVYTYIMAQIVARRRAKVAAERREKRVHDREAEAEERAKLRAEALHSQFDIGAAIREGHIRVVTSQGTADTAGAPADSEPQDTDADA